MFRGVIYARYSCDKQTDNSIRGQVRECALFAERNDIQIINTYADEAISGRTDKRPAFLKMIRDAHQHQFDVIVVWKGDRFSRNRADAAKYKNELKKLGIRLLSATEANLTGAEAILMDGVNEAFAEFYSVELAEKVTRGLIQNVIEGRFTGGTLILGYKLDENHRIVVDEEGAKTVREFFNMYAYSDISIHDLVRKLNRLGYKNNGKAFTYQALDRLLSNRKYIGEFKFKDQINLKTYAPLVSEEVFNKVQEKMKTNKRDGAKYRASEKYILTGKAFCGECGGPLKAYTGISSSGSHNLYRYYKCGGARKEGCQQLRYNKVPLEKAVIDIIVKFITQDMDVDTIVNKVMKSYSQVNPEIDRLESALQETEQAIKNYKYALEKGLDLDETIERLKELSSSKKAYKDEIDRLKRQEDMISPDTIKSYLRQMAERDYSKDENRMYLINVLVYKIIVYKDDRIVVILNTGGDEGPTELESTVRLLVGSDHHNAENVPISWTELN